MPERFKSILTTFIVPLLVLASAWGVMQYKVERKEDASSHQVDIQRLEAQQNAMYSLLLDVRCQQEPNDRRCK